MLGKNHFNNTRKRLKYCIELCMTGNDGNARIKTFSYDPVARFFLQKLSFQKFESPWQVASYMALEFFLQSISQGVTQESSYTAKPS